MKRWVGVALCTLVLLVAPVVLADGPGNVVQSRTQCNYVLIHTPLGFSLAEWYGGTIPEQGDKLMGQLATHGLTILHIGPHNQETLVNISEALLPQEVAISRYMSLCP